MPVQLNTAPGSSTKRQHQVLVLAGRQIGFDLAEIRKDVGGSLCRLSARECSDCIKRYSGRDLPHPPGEKPKRRKGQAGVTRMITAAQIEQLHRLLGDCFKTPHARQLWLTRNFKVAIVKHLATAKRGGEVIRVLKLILQRRSATSTASVSDRPEPSRDRKGV